MLPSAAGAHWRPGQEIRVDNGDNLVRGAFLHRQRQIQGRLQEFTIGKRDGADTIENLNCRGRRQTSLGPSPSASK